MLPIIGRIQNTIATFIEKAGVRRQLIDTLLSLVGINLFLAGLSFLTTLVIANVLGKEPFGALSYAIAVGGYFVTIACCGLERTLTRDLVHFPQDCDEYTSASILLRGSMVVLGFIVILSINSLASEENRLGIAGVLIVLALGVKALDLAPVYDAWNKMKRHAVYFFIERCLYFACVWSLLFLYRDRLSINVIAAFILFSTAIGLTLQYWWAFPRFNFRLDHKTVSLASGMLNKNLWIWSGILATLSFGGLSKIVLKLVSGNSELGGYAVAWQVVMLGSILITQIGRLGNPRMAKIIHPSVTKNDQTKFLVKYISLMVVATSFVSLPSVLIPQKILQMFRPEYATSAGPMAILGVYVMVVGIGQIATQYLIMIRKEKFYSITVIFCGLFGMFLYTLFIPRWQALGAALAVLISHGSLVFIHSLVALLHLRTNPVKV